MTDDDRLKSYTVRTSLARDGVSKHYTNEVLGTSRVGVCELEITDWVEMLDLNQSESTLSEDGVAHATASRIGAVKVDVRVQ
jgi:hypothetical protein